MDNKEKFSKILEKSSTLALATSAENIPNVRIVNFCQDKQHPEILYFASDRENNKVREFLENKNIAFTTIPAMENEIAHVRSNNAVIEKSRYSIYELKDIFIEKIPAYVETIEEIGELLDIFEIHIKKAVTITGYDDLSEILF